MEDITRILGIIFATGAIPALIFRTSKRTRTVAAWMIVTSLVNAVITGGLFYGFKSYMEIPSFGGFGKLSGVDINGAWMFFFVSLCLSLTWCNLIVEEEG